MVLAEVSGETAIGASVFSLLAVLCIQVFRRQSDTDTQRAAVAAMAINLANEQRARANAERDTERARAEIERERAENERARADAAEARAETLQMELTVERERAGEERP